MINNNFDFNALKTAHYDRAAKAAVFGYEQLYNMILAILCNSLGDYANVLVVGCGTGMELVTFGQKKTNWKITGVDPSEEMIKSSVAKIAKNNLTDRITLHHGITDDLPEEEYFDAATLVFVMRFIPSKTKKLSLLKSIAKRLKPDGKIIIVDQHGDFGSEQFRFINKAWRNYMKLNGIPAELVMKITAQAMEQSFFTVSELKQFLSKAGFENMNQFYNAFLHGGWIAQKK